MLIPSEVRRDIENCIRRYRLEMDIRGLETYLNQVQLEGKLAASLSNNSADINYRNARAVCNALIAQRYESYAAPILEILGEKPKAEGTNA